MFKENIGLAKYIARNYFIRYEEFLNYEAPATERYLPRYQRLEGSAQRLTSPPRAAPRQCAPAHVAYPS